MAYDTVADVDGKADAPEDEATLDITDEELLGILQSECRASVGFDHDSDLVSDREKALNYYKGVMEDVPSLPNRSSAVSTDVADAIETVLPDLMEIFTGGDDVVTFVPNSEQDAEAARDETDYLNFMIFQEAGGFLTFYSMFKDALLLRLGVVKYWWQDSGEKPTRRRLSDEASAVALLADNPQASGTMEPGGGVTVTIPPKRAGRLCIKAIPPEDFTVAKDTVELCSATYCASRSRPRAQDLLAQGIDPEIVERLPAYGAPRDDELEQARDGSDESAGAVDGATGDLRQVETVEHYLRRWNAEAKEMQLWRVVTGGGETVLIEKEKVERIQIAAVTPYPIAHRLLGMSMADFLMEVQKIKTALTRAYLDANYFALNQRVEVNMIQANEFTIPDLLNNVPGMPVRTKGDALKPITAGGAGFNQLDALEYFSTVAEQRSGVVRNAQGLNPDTLHDTAKGALALMSAAQRRMRLIARVFAETGLKDLFVGIHALMRSMAGNQGPVTVPLRGKWKTVDASQWGERMSMSVEIGQGAKEEQLAQARAELEVLQGIVQQQGGLNGPLVTADNAYNLVAKLFRLGGAKNVDEYLTNPKEAPPQQPQPDPEMAKAQAKIAAEQAKTQAQAQVELMKAQAKMQIDQQTAQHKLELQAQKNALDLELAQRKHDADFALKQQEAELTAELKRREQAFEMALAARRQSNEERANVSGATFGGDNP